MANAIHFSPLALRDLDEIWDYISEDLQNPSAASNTVGKILATIEILENFPESGSKLSSIVEVESDYRYLVCGNYLAFYRTQKRNIYIDRILYGKRDYLKILFSIE